MSAPRSTIPAPQLPHPLTRPGPIVPDPSIFFPETPLHPSPCPRPPQPTDPSTHLLRPQSDFSHVFHHTEATMFLQGSDTAQFEVLERHVQFNSTDSYREQQSRMVFPHPTQALGPSNLGPSTLGPSNSGPSTLAPSNLGPSILGPRNSGPSTLGPSTLGPNTLGPSTKGSRTLGPRSSTSCPSLPSSPPQAGASPGIHPDLVQVLAWQNDQLKKLQEQVTALLAVSPQPAPLTPPVSSSSASPHLRKHSNMATVSTSTVSTATVSTATVSTNTSLLWPDIQRGLARLRDGDTLQLDELRKSQVAVSREESTASPQPSLHIDLPEYQDSPVEGGGHTGQGTCMTSWSSPVLGESVSMYEDCRQQEEEEGEEVAELYHNILGQVKRLLAQDFDAAPLHPATAAPVPTLTDSAVPSTAPAPATTPATATAPAHTPAPTPATAPTPAYFPAVPVPDPRAATMDRLRQMGVSFISPADLAPSSSSSLPYNSVYLPRASLPTQSVFQGPDTSLDISSLALKYLDDEQLSQLAVRHQAAGQEKKQVTWDRGPPPPGAELSMASHQFLARHGLGEAASRTGLQQPSQPPALYTNGQPSVPSSRADYLLQPGEHRHDVPVVTGDHQTPRLPPVFPRGQWIEPPAQQPLPPLLPTQPRGRYPQPLLQTRGQPQPLVGQPQPPRGQPHSPRGQPQPPRGQPQPLRSQPQPPGGQYLGPPGPHFQMSAPQPLVDRVLDITAIRQQPKLL